VTVDWKNLSWQWAKANPDKAARRIRDLERENAALRADKERLDWCDRNDAELTKYKQYDEQPGYVEITFFKNDELLKLYEGTDCRAAIDAARKEEP